MSFPLEKKLDQEPLLPVAADDVSQPNAPQHPPSSRRTKLRRFLAFGIATFSLFYFIHSAGYGPKFQHLLRAKCAGKGMKEGEHAWAFDAFLSGGKHSVKPIRGKAAEDLFLTVPNSASAVGASRQFATTPHLAGSDGDLRTAYDFLALLQEQLGISPPEEAPVFPAGSAESRHATLSINKLDKPAAWIDVYYPVQNTPLEHSLEILEEDGSVAWAADLEEQSDGTDEEATKYRTSVPTWHGLSKDGEATGKIIYANYGRKADYDDLVEKGVNFTGAIVLARYGGVFRGLKVKAAEELGAAGVLIYSDPRDDGTVTEENGYTAYPHGPARNPTSVQRGSVQYLSMYPGDPTTPGVPAYENATRTNGLNIPSIPSLPISWANAKVLLDELEGSNRAVKFVNRVDTRVTPIWNPMGVIPGHIRDEVIIVGNHRDAWVMGASDPTSGTVSVHEVLRGVGVLLKAGWKPLRTIVFASWDAEEYGLIGSTEWGEDFADWIQDNVVAYFNLDSSVSGSRFDAGGSPSFSHFIRDTAQAIPHPTDPGRTLWDARHDKGPLFGENVDAEVAAMHEDALAARDEVGVKPLGSGSDYTVFLQRLGVASLNSGFGGTLGDPVYHYHSIFDSERWMEVYSDPGFVKHVAIAQLLGLQTIRLADSIILPVNTTHYAVELENYLDAVQDLAEASVLSVNLAPLRASIKGLQHASVKLDHRKAHAERRMRYAIHKFEHWRRHHGHHGFGVVANVKAACGGLKKMLGFGAEKHQPMHGMHHVHHHGVAWGEAHVQAHKHNEPTHGDEHREKAHAEEKHEYKHESHEHVKAEHTEHEQEHKHTAHAEGDRPEVRKGAGLMRRPGNPSGCTRQRLNYARAHRQHQVKDGGLAWPPHPRLPWNPKKALMKAAKEVREVNAKLAKFEQGFVHEDGIKDREWYRHLGVAPGKWLGYGATTLPALTEAITIEKNATLAAYEAKRLEDMIDGITKGLRK